MSGKTDNDGSPDRPDLKGMPSNPGRDPKVMKMSDAEKGSVGYIALKDAIALVAIAWLIVLFCVFSLRHYNV